MSVAFADCLVAELNLDLANAKKIDNGTVGENAASLQGEHLQRRSRGSAEPADRKEQDYRHLTCHQELPDMCGGTFILGVKIAEKHRPGCHHHQRGQGQC